MKLICDFEMVDMGEEIVAVPVGASASRVKGVLKVNTEGREIIELLKKDMTVDGIVLFLSKKYDNDQEELLKYVNDTIRKLNKAGLIVD